MLYKQVVQTQYHLPLSLNLLPMRQWVHLSYKIEVKRPGCSSKHNEGVYRMSPAVALRSTRAESQRAVREGKPISGQSFRE